MQGGGTIRLLLLNNSINTYGFLFYYILSRYMNFDAAKL